MQNPHIVWASVVIIMMMVAGAVTLAAIGKPTTDITNLAVLLGLPVLAGMGMVAYQKISQGVDQVKDTNNGRMSDMLGMIKDLQGQVSQPQPDLLNMVRELQNQVTQLALQAPSGSSLPNGGTTTGHSTTTTTTTHTEP